MLQKKNCVKWFVTLNREFGLCTLKCVSSSDGLNTRGLGEVGSRGGVTLTLASSWRHLQGRAGGLAGLQIASLGL